MSHMCVHILCICPPALMDRVSVPIGNQDCCLLIRMKKGSPKPDGAMTHSLGFEPRASATTSQCISSILCYQCG